MDQTIEVLLAQKAPVLYNAGHVSIRQLAEKLRSAMKDSSKGGKDTKAMQYAFGLPFVKTLKLWVQAVSKSEALRPLLEPLVVVILSAIRAKENHLSYIPYVSVLLGLLNDLSVNCQVFIPMGLSCLSSIHLCANRLSSNALSTEGREPNISDVVRVSERNLKDRRVVVGLLRMLLTETGRHMAFLARTPALPEVGWVIVQNLRKTSKLNSQVKAELAQLIASVEKSIEEVKALRKGTVDQSNEKSTSLLQYSPEQTSVGKYMLQLIAQRQASEHSHHRGNEDVQPDEENSSESEESAEDSAESDSGAAVRSKRSLKRERQKEKKRLAKKVDQGPNELVESVAKKARKIDLMTELVPMEVSDDE